MHPRIVIARSEATWRPEREARGSALGVQSREGTAGSQKAPVKLQTVPPGHFRQNVFDISDMSRYNKDVETPTVATTINFFGFVNFIIHKSMSRLVGADGSLFFFSEPVDDLEKMPDDRKDPEQILKCYVYHLLRDISRRSYIPASIPLPRDDRQPSLNRTPSIGINHGRRVSTFLS